MTENELALILQEGESYFIEFKEGISSLIARELVAFSNASGGRILIGVDDKGVVKGTDTGNTARSRIQDFANNCQPRVRISLEVFNRLLIVHVPEGKDKPYHCSEGFFIRMGTNAQKMTRDEIADFLQAEGRIRFEEQYHRTFDFSKHYDSQRLEAFLRLAGIRKEFEDAAILENLGVADRIGDTIRMKNAGVLFFSKSIESLCEQATITCGAFEGIERFQIVNRKDYQGDIITNINLGMHFIQQELRVRYSMTGTARRKEIFEIPVDAIREALVNAVSHRDYFQYGSHTTVDIFDDRIEISNPGGLPKGLSEAEFGRTAVRRNQIIASLLQRVNLVENMGTGIGKIRRLLKEAGCAEPKFEFGNFYTITFPRRWAAQKKKTTQKLPRKTTQKLPRNYPETTVAQQRILDYLTDHPMASRKEIAGAVTGITVDGVKYNLKILREKGVLLRIGPDRGGQWQVRKQK
jgi:ATP-dependent DNA helicase RecG